MKTVFRFLLVMFSLFTNINSSFAQWVQTNGPGGGNVLSLAVNGTNLFAGTYGGGVFLSTNNGTSWTTVNTGLTNTIVRSLAVNGTNLFAGTNGGVFLSTNNGTSWTEVNTGLPTNTTVRSLAVNGTNLFAGTNGGVFLSTNNGTSWTAVNTGLPTNTTVRSLAVNGTNLFAGTYGGGVFLSTNNGTSWTTVNTGLTNTDVYSLAVNGTNLFAGTYGGGVFLSTNNGTSWTAVTTGLTNTIVFSLAVNGTNLFAGTNGGGVFLSTNNGTSWTEVNTGLTNTTVWSLAVNGTNLFAGTNGGGVSLSTNNGTSWTAANMGLTNTSVRSLAVNGTNLFAGTNGGGVSLSTNNGTNWVEVSTGLTYSTVMSLAVSGTNLFAGTWGGGVFLSTNNGTSWTAAGLGFKYISSLAVNGTNLFAGTYFGGVMLSINNGTSWTDVNTGLPANTTVRSLAVNGTNLFAGTENGGVFLSTNNGTSWTAVSTGLPTSSTILSLAVNGTNLFAGTYGGGVFLSTNNGTSWTAASTGLTNTYVLSLAVNGTNLFAGTNAGVFLSTNNGTSWTKVNTGLPTPPLVWSSAVWSLAVNGTNLFAGTDGGGVCRHLLSEFNTGLSLISPNGGETWKVGSTHAITWTSSLVSNVTLEYSVDNGTNWTLIASSISAAPGSYNWVVPNTQTGQALVRITDTSNNTLFDVSDVAFTVSQTFMPQFSGTNKHLNDVCFVSTATGWAVGDKVIIKTLNGGVQWNDQTQNLGTQTLKNIQWSGVSFIDANNGWVVGPSGSDAVVIRTTDGGQSWPSQLQITKTGVIPNDITFSDLTHGWLVGNNGKIFSTVNGGVVWTEVLPHPTSEHLNGVSIIKGTAYIGYAVGANGTVLKTTDGLSWSSLTSGTVNNLNDMNFVDVNHGWVVGNNGTILVTTDGGATSPWQSQTSGTTAHLNGVSFVNLTLGWAVGNNGTILRYDLSQFNSMKNSNAASSAGTWSLVPSGTKNDLDAIVLFAGTAAYVIGDSGTVLSYSLPLELTISWRMQLKALISSYQDNENFAGVSDNATEGQDASFDTPEPPTSPGNYVSLYFPHAEWNSIIGNNFANDIKLNTALADTVKRWYFQVTSNVVNDTMTLTFVNDRIPSPIGKYLTDLNTGKRINLKNISSYKYYNTSAVARSFMLIIGDSTAPSLTLTTPNGNNICRSGTTKNIMWSTSDGTGIDTIFVYSSSNVGTSYSLLTSLGFTQLTNWNVPNEYLNHNYSIKIIARDSLGNESTVRSAKTFTVVGDSLATSNPAGWSLISVPLTPNDSSISSIFDNTTYLWSYVPSTGFTQPSTIILEKGYWLGVITEKNWFVKGTANESDSSSQNLQLGYNVIGNNFVRNVSKTNLYFLKSGSYYNFSSAVTAGLISNALYGYSSSTYSSIDTMSVFGGYWIGVLQSGVQLIQKPNVSIVTPLAKQTQIFAMNWELPIKVSTASLTDNIAMIGIKQNSTADFDAQYDAPRPPRNPGNNYLEMYFTHTGGNYPAILGSKYAKDFRDSSSANWNFTIENSQTGDVTLSWNKTVLEGLAGTLQLSLKDNTSGSIIDMKQVGTYTFTYSTPRLFSINAKITKVEKNRENLPTEFSLSQNYPNPFNPSSTIRYDIPKTSFVKIIVYDILGREIRVLVNEEKSPGRYEILFDAKELTSGIYFYTIKTAGFIQSKKMILMK